MGFKQQGGFSKLSDWSSKATSGILRGAKLGARGFRIQGPR